MADKGFAAAQATFPTLSFWGFGNFTPILFRWSQWHLCGGGVFFCCFEGKRRVGARVGTGLLHSRVFPGPAQRLFSPLLWVWLLSGFVWVGKGTAESSLRCTLTKFVFRQWTGRVTSGQPFPFSFCSTESAPSTNPGNNNPPPPRLVCRHSFRFLKMGPWLHLLRQALGATL